MTIESPPEETSLPKDSEITFLVAEDVRREVDGKATFVGVYPSDNILFKPGAEQIIPTLAIIFIVKGGVGEHLISLDLLSPSHQAFANLPPQMNRKRADQAHVVATKLVSFRVKELGRYAAILRINSEVYRRFFTIAVSSDG